MTAVLASLKLRNKEKEKEKKEEAKSHVAGRFGKAGERSVRAPAVAPSGPLEAYTVDAAGPVGAAIEPALSAVIVES